MDVPRLLSRANRHYVPAFPHRSHQKQEIDYLEELNGSFREYEIKERKARLKSIGALSLI